jgi:hypothetical protein
MPIVSLKSSIEIPGFVSPEPIKLELGIDELNYPGLVEVSASGTETVDFSGPATASFLFIRGNRACTVNLNGLGAFTMNAGGSITLFNVSITSLTVINSDSSNTLNLEILLGGT